MNSNYSFVDASGSAVSSTGGSVTQPTVSNAGVVSGTMQANQEHDAYFRNRTTRSPVPLQIIKVYAKDQTERINEVSFMLYSDAAHNTPAADYEGNPIGLITTGGYADEEETIPLGYARIGDLWPGTYYLVETVTPAGYRPPSDHMVITIGNDGSVTLTDPDNASATGTGNVTEVNGIVTVAIPNTKYSDAVLPRTGGMGSTLFYISGGLLITAAAAIYIFCFRRRKGGKTEPDFLM
jgi:LPXTG-motif cell wall-anchored protein